jgi:hypothetical protein
MKEEENYFVQLFRHNNMIINEQTLKERNQLFELIYYLQLCHARAWKHPPTPPHTHSTPYL